MSKKRISIFTPVFNEEKNIDAVYARVKEVMATRSDRYDYEHVFSDNASTDGSFERLTRIHARDKHVKAVKLSRNFGVTKSTLNGLLRCSGDAVIQLDADLEDPPEMIADFLAKWEEGYKVVYGVREDRDEAFPMKWVRKMYYRLAAKLATDTLIPDVGEFRLMDRRIVEELKKIEDYNPYLRGVIANLGFKQVGIPYKRAKRQGGKTSTNLFSLIDYGLNGIVSHSRVLLRLSTITGLFLAAAAFVLALLFAVLKFILSDVPVGLTPTLMLILFFSGVQMIFLGIIGEYVAKIFDQSIKRPVVVEEETVGF